MIAAICVPPLGLWLSTIMFKTKFTRDERAMGKTCLPTGIFGITEGAIPFASADPVRVIPSCMLGCGITGVVSVLLGAKFVGGVAGPLGLFTYGNTAQFQNNYAW
jgi:PTS system mannose-specific IIC component